ncbi:hypothetical protein PROFUN_13956 [Planoprotostelium fungivorum]|uniref:Uncharacterized protein n=1 Tax=Planoprotostelium fungivorum TaxID=1890364 RepID=A0A2P6N2H1_9EUKA|nr:hypothetical protein PROFUN_13956 [Planoprotostelium fungivorum]
MSCAMASQSKVSPHEAEVSLIDPHLINSGKKPSYLDRIADSTREPPLSTIKETAGHMQLGPRLAYELRSQLNIPSTSRNTDLPNVGAFSRSANLSSLATQF